ncbi:MAG: helix-turn-helix transcriptional regulator [Candidatus Poribacteria bacterium]|nr:helix-turn-helix transcriptional regulator [Candidatus Poribacteria bacterium]
MADEQENTREEEQEINRHFLKYLRENAQLTQEQLAEEVNVEPELVMHWETGRRQPNQKQQFALERFFNIRTGALADELRAHVIQDFYAAYFRQTGAQERVEWAEEHLRIAQALRIMPADPNKHDTLKQ